jgi:glycerol-3-phosphate dehydrogenase
MKRDLRQFSRETYDVVVVGGGIIGTGIARDAAMRGLKTLLVEKEDFAYGTTSGSTRLIHGGLRYLRQLEFHLVRVDMKEREVLLGIAPHLVTPLPFLIPVTSQWNRLVMCAGMMLYDLLSFDKSLPRFRYFSRNQTLEMEPDLSLDGLVGSYLYYDCQIAYAERLCIENVLSAAENGASVANHTRVTGIAPAGDAAYSVQVEDTLTGQSHRIATRLVVNAAGPWMDQVYGMLDTRSRPMLRRTKGIHLVTPKLSNNALVLFSRSDGRLFFVIPWEGYSIIGTTDTDYTDDSDTVHADDGDVDYLLREVQHAFPDLEKKDIFYTYAGLRALAGSSEGRASNVTRSHKMVDHETADGIKGLISVIGGKITGFREIAEEVTDLACKKLGVTAACTTAQTPLPGAPSLTPEKIEQTAKESGLPVTTVAHLNHMYGSRLFRVLEMAEKDRRGKQPVCPHSPDILAQVWHAVLEEGALTPADFLLRRGAAGLASCQGLDAIDTVAAEMRKLLDWSAAEEKRQIEDYHCCAALGRRFQPETKNNNEEQK